MRWKPRTCGWAGQRPRASAWACTSMWKHLGTRMRHRERKKMKNEHALRRLAAIVAIALLPGCIETKTGSNGTGNKPTKEESFVAGTLVGAEPLSVGSASLDTGGAPIRRDETANAG